MSPRPVNLRTLKLDVVFPHAGSADLFLAGRALRRLSPQGRKAGGGTKAVPMDSDAAASVVADEKVGAEKFVKDSTSTETLPSMPDSAASEEVVFEETGAPEASEKAPIELRKIFVGGLSFQTTEAELVVRTHPAHPPAPTIAHQTAGMRSRRDAATSLKLSRARRRTSGSSGKLRT